MGHGVIWVKKRRSSKTLTHSVIISIFRTKKDWGEGSQGSFEETNVGQSVEQSFIPGKAINIEYGNIEKKR